ncbi:MAG: N-acetylmuramoyl-L-alanine amidase [Candidatus Theseobacter exili]|nr:N-acetylmuramoyl-L-alanine amidase [Candidatus Theseobacter exili]
MLNKTLFVPAYSIANTEGFYSKWSEKQKTLILWNDNLTLLFKPTSRLFLANGATRKMDHPAQLIHGMMYLPYSFRKKTLSKVRLDLKNGKLPGKWKENKVSPSKLTVILDPGHGGPDPGAIGRSGTREKYIVLDIAQRVARILKSKGIHVIMTRKADYFITLWRRAYISKLANADVFVSIHGNAHRKRSVKGIETFYPRNSPGISRKERHRHNNSRKLAKNIQYNLIRQTGSQNRGVKPAGFYVIKNCSIPSALVEVGFLTHAYEERKLRQPSYREIIARGIAIGIIKYIQTTSKAKS